MKTTIEMPYTIPSMKEVNKYWKDADLDYFIEKAEKNLKRGDSSMKATEQAKLMFRSLMRNQ